MLVTMKRWLSGAMSGKIERAVLISSVLGVEDSDVGAGGAR